MRYIIIFLVTPILTFFTLWGMSCINVKKSFIVTLNFQTDLYTQTLFGSNMNVQFWARKPFVLYKVIHLNNANITLTLQQCQHVSLLYRYYSNKRNLRKIREPLTVLYQSLSITVARCPGWKHPPRFNDPNHTEELLAGW